MIDPTAHKKIKKILIQRADRLGDVVFCLPVVHWLRSRYPDAEIHFFAAKQPAEFLRYQLGVDRVHVAPMRWSILTLFGTAARLRQHHFDLVISLWNDPWLVWVMWLARIPIRIGDSTNLSLRWMHTHTVRQRWEHINRHQILFNLDLLGPLGRTANSDVRFESDVALDARRKIKSELLDANDRDAPVVVLVCGSGGSNSPLPDGVLNAAIVSLSESNQVVLVGFTDQNIDAGEGVINRLNQTTMAELSAWLAAADVVVSADTGPAHIAASLNRPIVFIPLRKSNLPTRWGPWTQDFIILRRDHECNALPPGLCAEAPCPAWPTAPEIVAAVDRLLMAPRTISQRERSRLFFRASIHTLIVTRSPVHAHAMKRLRDRWGTDGHTVIVVPSLSWRQLVAVILRYNTLVVVAPGMGTGKARWVRFWIASVAQYLPPLIIRGDLDVGRRLTSFEDELADLMDRQEGVV